MYTVYVRFVCGRFLSTKEYVYKSKLNFIPQGKYDIEVDNTTTYDNPVVVTRITQEHIAGIREITDCTIIDAPKKPDGNVENIYINKKKRTICVRWKDKTSTIVKCHPDDTFDVEKGIAMCFMKKAFNNRGCFNDVIKPFLGDIDE